MACQTCCVFLGHPVEQNAKSRNATIVSQPSKCLKFMTFREGCLSYTIECKYLSEALKTFYQH